ncbi:MAG: energy transducer TonB, partial [Spirochaetaceae bacterium]
SLTRGREPVPMPAPAPEPSSHQPEMETIDPVPVAETEESAVLNTEPTAAAETDAPAETAAQSPMVPQPVRHQKQAVPPVRFEKPRPLQPIDAGAVYPLGSRLRGEEGIVRLLARIGSDGRVEGLKIGESSGFPALDRAAKQAVWRTRFSPATQNNRAVADEITITIHFRLDS